MKTIVIAEASRAKVEVEVEPDEVKEAVNAAATEMGRRMKLPGFRKGKIPPALVVNHLGFPAVFAEASRDNLSAWYEKAFYASGIAGVGDPDVAMRTQPEKLGEPLLFEFKIMVRPPATLGEYKGLEVEKVEARPSEEVIDAEVDRLRDTFARWITVDREAAIGDTVVLDFIGKVDDVPFDGGEGHSVGLELGSGKFIEGFEEQLVGAHPGEEIAVEVHFPEDYIAEGLRGKDAVFDCKVEEIRELERPEVTDEFAEEASEFPTVEAMREGIARRLIAGEEEQAEQEYRTAVVDAVVAGASIELAPEVAEARSEDMLKRFESNLGAHGVQAAAHFASEGKTREEVLEENRVEADTQLRREAVLAAIADVEGLEPTEEELLEALGGTAGIQEEPAVALKKLRAAGREAVLRSDVRMRQAIDLVVDAAAPPAAKAAA